MRRALAFLLLMCGCFVAQAQDDSQPIRIYPYRVNPQDYPINERRPSLPATRDLFSDRMQFQHKAFDRRSFLPGYDRTGGSSVRLEEKIFADGLKPKHLKYAKSVRNSDNTFKLAGYKIFRTPKVAHQNYNERAHIAGSYSDISEKFYDLAGPRFLGLQFGESDASYLNLSPGYISPMSRDHRRQYLDYQRYFEHYGNHIGNRVVLHVNEGTSHYLMKEGTATIAEAQTFYRGKVNPLVHYVFLRGASKQYGILLGMGFSTTTPHGGMSFHSPENIHWAKREIIKAYGELIPDPKHYPTTVPAYKALRMYFQTSSDRGSSLSLFRRLMYSNYMYNGVVMNYEPGAYYNNYQVADENGKDIKNMPSKLSPIGEQVRSVREFVEKNPHPGNQITPVAFYMDFFNGWRTPDSRKKAMRVWTNIPYGAGDYFTDNLFSMFYPGYRNVGLYKNVSFGMTATPYGDNVDAIFSDAEQEVLDRYALMVVAGELKYDLEYQRHKILEYVKAGGRFVVTGDNARKLFPEWGISEKSEKNQVGTAVTVKGNRVEETRVFQSLKIRNLPENSKAIARTADKILAFEKEIGKGKIIVSLVPAGITSKKENFSWKDDPNKMYPEGLGRPYYMPAHLERIIGEQAKAVMPFEVGENLGLVCNRNEKGIYTLAIFNNSLTKAPFEIRSNIGEIQSIKEADLADAELKNIKGFYPRGFEKYDIGKDTDKEISGYNVRIFKVKIKESSKLDVLPERHPVNRGNGRFLAMKSMVELKERILCYPSFFTYFDGVKIDLEDLRAVNQGALEENAKWFNRKRVRFVIDARNADEKAVLSAMEKTKSLDLADDWLVNKRTKTLGKAADKFGRKLHTEKSGGVDLIEKLKKPNMGALQVLTLEYANWDQVFGDYLAVWEANPYQKASLAGEKPENKYSAKANLLGKKEKRYLTVRTVSDLELAKAGELDGILLNARLVFEMSEGKFVSDFASNNKNLRKTIVDFRPFVDGYRQVVFEKEWGVTYDKGLSMSEDVMRKMKSAGVESAIVPTDKFFKKGMAGFEEFCGLAKKHGISLVLEHSKKAQPKELATLRETVLGWGVRKVSVAGNPQLANTEAFEKAGLTPEFWLLRFEDFKRRSSPFYPISQARGKRPFKATLENLAGQTLVYDAEYMDKSELREDLGKMEQ
ncbi:hypothetical protein FUAX_19190 [Fulvitalea axinellae]|uniref:Beta-galactosidase trimerisation domain-containing protein n=1 Tax=Fulvitalea axinellae TaxID=1182444 RepID=A0AAU9CVM9_9BACT|nr:hypothetical protein FUAX_19190 [Fulvitalea axinellae]